jgi:hypothetical protein
LTNKTTEDNKIFLNYELTTSVLKRQKFVMIVLLTLTYFEQARYVEILLNYPTFLRFYENSQILVEI